ncbi:MAG: helix-turn-helix domain-containing protein [Oscillospiraceae bacterium]|nr:helix-turn-helix domain-containing protein [Oscillospiraceae bacterium]
MAIFRVEKTRDFTVMSNHHLKNKTLSLKAKGLQSLMLSLPEEWDYSTRGLARICKDGVDSISAALTELERHGYLTRRRLRDANGRLGDTEYTIHEQPVELSTEQPDLSTGESPKREKPVQVKPILEKLAQDSPVLAKPEQENPAQLSINKSSNPKNKNTHGLNISSINLETSAQTPFGNAQNNPIDSIDGMYHKYRELIMENLDYDIMCERCGTERTNEAVELMLETVMSNRDYIRIAGDDFPKEAVKSRLLKLDGSHLEYVFDCIDKNTTKVRNVKAYLLASLYNSPATMDTYYRVEVNHDMYGGGNGKK